MSRSLLPVNPERSPSRLGLWDALIPRFAAVGWLDGEGSVTEDAAPLLRSARGGPDPEGGLERLVTILEADPGLAARSTAEPLLGSALVAVAGASRVLGATLATHPEWLEQVVRSEEAPPLPVDTTDDPDRALAQLRHHTRWHLLRISILDLLGKLEMPAVGRALADLADTVADRALVIAHDRVVPRLQGLDRLPIGVVAMGKWGGAELNYSSDIDCLFVYEHPVEIDPHRVRDAAQRIASRFIGLLSEVTRDGVAFRVDANLRPEGKNGPLARTLDSYRAYYEGWAEPWEFQALLKARPAAGDLELGARLVDLVEPKVWPETLDPTAIRSIRVMKGRIESRAEQEGWSAVEIKRGFGGIRDIEFPVQLLQLVHGRFDPALRAPATLDALEALGTGGYVRRDDVAALAGSYRWLRTLEHRLQLWDLHQTHALPTDPAGRERVAKAIGYRDGPDLPALTQFEQDLLGHRGRVRGIHEQLFYRPLLESFAASPAIRLTPDEAARQLAALGFRDAAAAGRAFDELTAGLSRRSNLMQQLLPLMLDWLSETPDPDLGLEQLRLLVTTTSDNARLIGLLRDEPVATQRLCRLLGTSRLLGTFIDRLPDFLHELGDDRMLAARPSTEDLAAELRAVLALRDTWEDRLAGIRRFVRRRLLRVAGRDLLGVGDEMEVGEELTAVADAASMLAIDVADQRVRESDRFDHLERVPFVVIALGRWGAGELSYPSDLDLIYLYGTPEEADPALVRDYAIKLAIAHAAALGEVRPEGIAFRVDPDLRPEGKAGPMARSLESTRAYYAKWAQPWEFLALLKARVAAGDGDLGRRFLAMIAPDVWPDPLTPDRVRAIRTMKARVETERIPPGEDPDFHLKLGPGGLSDVEFTVQLLQQRHGAHRPALRVPGTIPALRAAAATGLIPALEAHTLEEAFRFCTRARNRLYLQAGLVRDSLPTDPDEASRLGLALGYVEAPRSQLREEYRRLTRRARRVVEQRFYRDDPAPGKVG